MKKIRKRLTYANVMSTIAVFLILGGATAIAATATIGVGSVGPAQLQPEAVTAAKIQNDAITGDKIKRGAVTGKSIKNGSVDKSDIQKEAISSAKIDLKTLGTVPSAENAQTAVKAAQAESAAEAQKVAGQTPTKIFQKLPAGAAETTIASFGGFTLTAGCPNTAGHKTSILLHSPAGVQTVLTSLTTGHSPTVEEYEAGPDVAIRLNNTGENGEATFSAATAGGTVVSGSLGFDSPPTIEANICVFYGEVLAG